MRHVFALALFALASAAGAAPPDVPAELRTLSGQNVTVSIKATGEIGFRVVAAGGEEPFFDEFVPRGGSRRFLFQSMKPGRFTIVFWNKGDTDSSVCTILVGDVPPDPKPPTPPDPPKPPEPLADNPFGAMPGLRVLIVTESATERDLPVDQYLVIRGAKFREYLDSKCVADGYRMFDPNVKGDGWFRKALDRTDRKSLPWLYVGKESTGYSGPLPKDVDATIALLAKYAGK